MTGYGDFTPDWEALFKAFLAFAEYDTGSNRKALGVDDVMRVMLAIKGVSGKRLMYRE